MGLFKNVDLRAHADAATFVKNEVVEVTFAVEVGALQSREGLNGYAAGDALVKGSTGDHWSVTRRRFDVKYSPVAPTRAGANGRYSSIPLPVLAVRISEDFAVERSAGGDLIHGQAGDWLMQYAPGDHGIVAAAKFAMVYREVKSSSAG
jgi:PGDYG protein